jgi:hypothetical protein
LCASIAAPSSRLRLTSSNALPNVASQTNLSVAKPAETSAKPNRAKVVAVVAAVVAAVIRVQVAAVAAGVIPRVARVRCSQPLVLVAVRLLKFHLSRLEIVRFIAVIASRRRNPVVNSTGYPEPFVVSGAWALMAS